VFCGSRIRLTGLTQVGFLRVLDLRVRRYRRLVDSMRLRAHSDKRPGGEGFGTQRRSIRHGSGEILELAGPELGLNRLFAHNGTKGDGNCVG